MLCQGLPAAWHAEISVAGALTPSMTVLALAPARLPEPPAPRARAARQRTPGACTHARSARRTAWLARVLTPCTRPVQGGLLVSMAKLGARARVAALVGRLAPGRPAAEQEEAAYALARLCEEESLRRGGRQTPVYVRECGGIPALVGLLAPGACAAVREAAAGALGSLGMGGEHDENNDRVRECGGIAALVGLLAPGGSALLLRNAAGALANLCRDSFQNRECVRECGGVPSLVGLRAHGSSAAVKQVAAAALYNLRPEGQ